MSSATGLFLDLRSVEQSGDDRRRAHAHCNPGLHQLGASLFVGFFDVVVAVVHGRFFMAFGAGWEAE